MNKKRMNKSIEKMNQSVEKVFYKHLSWYVTHEILSHFSHKDSWPLDCNIAYNDFIVYFLGPWTKSLFTHYLEKRGLKVGGGTISKV